MVFEDNMFYKIIEPFWKIKKTLKHGIRLHESFCKYRNNKQIIKLLEKNDFKVDFVKKITKNPKNYRDKHYPTYIYEAIK